MSGPPPLPTALRKLNGNASKRPLNEYEPQPAAEIPECPDHLNAEARAEWARMVPELHSLGLLTRIDRAALAAYCCAWARWVEAENGLRDHGVLVKAPSGYPMQSPLLAVANKAISQMKSFLAEFGLSPASRTRLAVKPAAKDDDATYFFA